MWKWRDRLSRRISERMPHTPRTRNTFSIYGTCTSDISPSRSRCARPQARLVGAGKRAVRSARRDKLRVGGRRECVAMRAAKTTQRPNAECVLLCAVRDVWSRRAGRWRARVWLSSKSRRERRWRDWSIECDSTCMCAQMNCLWISLILALKSPFVSTR